METKIYAVDLGLGRGALFERPTSKDGRLEALELERENRELREKFQQMTKVLFDPRMVRCSKGLCEVCDTARWLLSMYEAEVASTQGARQTQALAAEKSVRAKRVKQPKSAKKARVSGARHGKKSVKGTKR